MGEQKRSSAAQLLVEATTERDNIERKLRADAAAGGLMDSADLAKARLRIEKLNKEIPELRQAVKHS